MNRRTLLKSLGAVAAVPFLPGLGAMQPAAAAVTFDARTIKWAELIARAHNKSSPAMLQRLMQMPLERATALHGELVRSGVVRAQLVNGVQRAAKPLWEGAVPKPHGGFKDIIDKTMDALAEENSNADSTGQCVTETAGDLPIEPSDEACHSATADLEGPADDTHAATTLRDL